MANKFRHGWLLLFSVMVFCICTGGNLWAEQYYYYDLGTGPNSSAFGINDLGNVVGTRAAGNGGFSWNNNVLTDLGSFQGGGF